MCSFVVSSHAATVEPYNIIPVSSAWSGVSFKRSSSGNTFVNPITPSDNGNSIVYYSDAGNYELLMLGGFIGGLNSIDYGLNLRYEQRISNNRGGTDIYYMICSYDYFNSFYAELSSHINVSLKEYLDTLYSIQTDLRGTNLWCYVSRYENVSASQSTLLSCTFTIPPNYTSDRIAVCVFSSIDSVHTSSQCLLQLFPIYVYPVGDSIRLLEEYKIDQQFRSDLIGSDEAGEESGLKGIFKKISQLPGQIGTFITGIGDRISGFFTDLKNKLSSLFTQLVENIKGLFIPPDGFFDDYKDQFDELLTDHLGALYQVDGIIVDLISHIVEFDPPSFSDEDPDFDIAIPVKKVYINADSDNWGVSASDPDDDDASEITLIPANATDGMYHVDLSFLEESPYSTIYGIYKAVVTCIIIFLMFAFARHEYDKFIGGNTG